MFLTRLLLVTLLSGPCVPQNQEESIILTLKSIAARQDSLLQKFDVLEDKLLAQHELLEDKLLAQHELLEDKLLAQHEQLENLKLSVGTCSTKHEISTFHDLLVTDECERNTHNCSVYATCRDSPIHFECSCLVGYSGDGVICEDIDECTDDSNVCGDDEVCVNLPGNYTCSCPDGYKKREGICQGYNCTYPSLELEPFGCVKYEEERLPWSNAQAVCIAAGGSLLHGFTNQQQLITILLHARQVGDRVGFGNNYSPWVGVKGGLFVKSPSDAGPSGTSSSPEAHLWLSWGRDGAVGDDTFCGFVDLYDPANPKLWDNQCSRPRASLCQILKY